jgi:hypothetical protein
LRPRTTANHTLMGVHERFTVLVGVLLVGCRETWFPDFQAIGIGVMASPKEPPFLKAAIAAFPFSCQTLAQGAVRTLEPFVDGSYRHSSVQAVVLGNSVRIPKRIHFIGLDEDKLQIQDKSFPAIQCLCTRSTDGYMRQSSLRRILGINEPWVVPFAVLLSGEYVVEIIVDMVAALSTLNRDAYVNFVRENRPLMRLLRSNATSYWNCYYRNPYPDRSTYPGLAFLHQLELWAA